MKLKNQILYIVITIIFFGSYFSPFVARASNPPMGYMDGFQQSLGIVSGWAADTDVPDQSLTVNFYVDGTQASGTLAGTVTANDASDDVNKVLLITGQHRFHWTIPSTYHDGKNHSLYIYGVDPSDSSVSTLLTNTPMNFSFGNSSPIAYFDGILNGQAVGWAYDADTPSQQVALQYYVDGTDNAHLAGQTSTTVDREDVNPAIQRPVGELHGFSIPLPSSLSNGTALTQGSHSLYIFALDTSGDHSKDIQITYSPKQYNISTLGDGSITSTVNGSSLTIKTSGWAAGTVTSLNYRGTEYIDNFDHGREMQSAAFFGNGECYNPTEGGARDDGTSLSSTSVLKSFNASGSTITSTNQMAFWLAPGETSPNCAGGTGTATNTTKLSDYILDKQITLGFQNLPNVIQWTSAFTLPRSHTSAQFTPVVYSPTNFSEFQKFSIKTKTVTALTISSNVIETGDVPIATTPDHNSAIAVYSPKLPDYLGLGYSAGSFSSQITSGHPTNSVGCYFRENNIAAGKYTYNCYVIVGTLSEVTQSLQSLVNYFSPDTSNLSKPNGNFDNISNGAVGGWAMDADTPSQPVTVQIYIDGTDSSHLAGQTTTTVDREDVNTVLKRPAGELHGFAWAIPAKYQDGQTHSVYIYAVDTGNSTVSNLVNGSPMSFKLGSPVVVSPTPTPTPATTTPTSTPIVTPSPSPTPTPPLTMPISYATYSSGTLVVDSSGTIYLISGGAKIPFSSMQAFSGLGYSLRNVVFGDASGYNMAQSYIMSSPTQEHPWGSWLLYGRTIYYSTQAGMVPVASWDVFINNGGQNKFILKANKADISVIKNNTLSVMQLNDNRIYH